MLVGPRTFLTLVVLTTVWLAGFAFACTLAGIFGPCLKGQVPRFNEIVLLVAIASVPNLFAFWLFRHVWRSDEFWVALGHRRRLWQIFLLTAYSLGVVAVIALLIMP